jgi:glycosyltransferase involved in cell wall biosynthesis
VAVLPFVATPYQIHLAQRLTRELPVVEFVFLYADESPDQSWQLSLPEDVNTVRFESGCPPIGEARLGDQWKFWARGGMIIDWMKRNHAQALVCYGHNDLGRLRLVRWCGRNGVPYFLAADSNSLQDRHSSLKRTLKSMYLRTFLARSSGVMVFGRRGVEYFARYGVPSSRAYPVPYGPDYALLESISQSEIESVRAELGLESARRRLVFCGRLVSFKRLDLLLQAFGDIATKRPEWDLLIIGDGAERDSLRKLVPQNLAQRCLWLGFVPELRRIGAFLHVSDVLVIPSDIEPWGLVVNEALACGLAVVSSSMVGAAADLVHTGDPASGSNGRVFKAGDREALAKALLEVTSPGDIDDFKRNSRRVLAEYRHRADPVAATRRALVDAGTLASDQRPNN